MHWSVNKSLGLQKILSLGFPRVLHKEGSISQPLGALKGSGYCLEALLHHEGRQLAQQLFLAHTLKTIYLGQLSLVMNKPASESESSSSGLVRFTHLRNAEDPTEDAIF